MMFTAMSAADCNEEQLLNGFFWLGKMVFGKQSGCICGGNCNDTTNIDVERLVDGMIGTSGLRLVRSVFADEDGDGVSKVKDCDDGDASLGSQDQDRDCDGYVSVEDCNDVNPHTALLSNDADCDGVWSHNDCDDENPMLHSRFQDPDCDGKVNESFLGRFSQLGIDISGSVQCWGDDDDGQVSDVPSGLCSSFIWTDSLVALTSMVLFGVGDMINSGQSSTPSGICSSFGWIQSRLWHDVDGSVQCWGEMVMVKRATQWTVFVQVSAGDYPVVWSILMVLFSVGSKFDGQ